MRAALRLAGPGTGIVIGRTAMSLDGADRAATEVASRYTHVFQTDGGTCGWSQRRELRSSALTQTIVSDSGN